MRQNSRFHVPEPAARPGDEADFHAIAIPPAGAMPRPPVDADPASMRDLAYGLIRVLDGDGRAVGPWNPAIAPEVLHKGLRAMLLLRALDERMVRMHRQGKISFYMKATGEEAVSVAATLALDARDMCFPTYRQQGILLARDWPLSDMLDQLYSNSRDRLKGRQMPVLYSAREAGFFSLSGNLTTQYVQAVGWAMAAASDNDSRIAAAWVGDGATAEGDFHHALTFAAVYDAPVILNIVNNQWAISSFSGIAGAEDSPFAARGIGYGLPALRVDGNDFLAVHAATRWAAERARQGRGASVIELFTYRAEAHSTSDDPGRYRPRGEGAQWPLGDPIARLRDHLIQIGQWSIERHEALAKEVEEEVRVAAREAESHGTLHGGERPPLSSLFDDVYHDLPPHLLAQRRQMLGERR